MSNSSITIDILEKNLERVISFINNCDSKVSYLLATTGVIISILFTTTPPTMETIKSVIESSEINLMFSVSIFGILISTAFFLKGINYSLKVLTANTNITTENTESMIFFGSISSQINSNSYIERIESSNYSYKDDLSCQIFINSKICDEKFNNYNKGLKLIVRSLPVVIICWSYIF